MTQKFTEEGVEKKVLDLLEESGWEVYGSPGDEEEDWGAVQLDEQYNRDLEEVIYWELLKEKIAEINDDIDEHDASDVIEKLKRKIDTENLIKGNKTFYKLLRNGIKHTPSESEEQIYVDLVDWASDTAPGKRDQVFTENNSLLAANQFRVHRKSKIRLDIVLFLNGIPIVPIELKATGEDSTVHDGIEDMTQYEHKEPRLFVPALMNAVCDGEQFRYAAIGAADEFYSPWRSDSAEPDSSDYYEPRDAITDLLTPGTLRDILRSFVFYEDNDAKIVPRYMQFQATNRIINRIRQGEPRKGLVWHTQGSGKSYTMLFTAHKAKRLSDLDDAQYVLIVDRQKLNEQMEETLHSIDFPSFTVAQSITHLEEELAKPKGQLILTTIQKFQDTNEDINTDVELPTVVMVDEAHRFQEAKLGNRLKAALTEDFFYFGFTGTPVAEGNNEKDRNTFDEFSPEGEKYLHRYSIEQGKTDGVITRVTFTKAQVEWDISEKALKEMDIEYEKKFSDFDPDEKQEVLQKYVNKTELAELKPRLRKVVKKIQKHYRSNVEPNGFKGMVVTPSRRAAALYGNELETYFNPEDVEVVITASGDDPPEMQRHHMSSEEERETVQDFKKKDAPKLLVVCDKLLTGFDAPVLKTMYLDKPMKNHNLLQAIARTNRPMEGKENGEIIDYQGVFENIEEVLEYEDFVIEHAVIETDKLVDEFTTLLESLYDMFDDITFSGDPEELKKAVVSLEKEPSKTRTFEKTYKRAQDLWETLMPHEALGRGEIESRWDTITQVYARFKAAERGEETPLGDDVREKTRKILAKHMDVEEVTHGETVEYEIPEREVETADLEQSEPAYGFIIRAEHKKDTLEVEKAQNPAYQSLSERVQQIIEDWRNDEITAEQGSELLDDIEDKQEDIEDEQDERGLTDEEYAIYRLLLDDYNQHVTGPDEARDVAKTIGDATQDISIGGNRPEVRRTLEATIINTLASNSKPELCKGENRKFVTEAVEYIIANREDNHAND